ncbi:hypothetical protein [Neisseria sp. Ec49-e6-T10]|uniref:hypothetical protein n=1 Tax=Neisseria sp. Ec49-e6-T10 TaxID=3140744 RepID=UPI003EC0FEA8
MMKNIMTPLVLSGLILLSGCQSIQYTTTGIVGEPAEPTTPEYALTCEQFEGAPKNASISVEFEASETLTEQIKRDLSRQNIKIVDKDQADHQYLIQSRFYARKAATGRVAQFEQLGPYIEDPKRIVYTEIPKRKSGPKLDLTYFWNPALLIGANIGANLPQKHKNKPWVQGEEGNPDPACHIKKGYDCKQYLFEQAVATTLTDQTTGNKCTIESKLWYYQAKPELLLDEHLPLIEQAILGKKAE